MTTAGGIADWTTGAAALVYQSCQACRTRWYFHRGFCPNCGSTEIRSNRSACHGTVYALTVVERAPSPEWRERAPYVIALVDLDEGVRVMTHAQPGLRIGDAVRITFTPAGGGSGGRMIPVAGARAAAAGEGPGQ